ncbi:hypothetical protein A0H81_08118 [Grifola frondosa]|uniref:RAI1-like domain-containing protein n=1 Tax=Grifola frondosa TaxID=5627 RepID=A0A1C7M6E5_GRIFR|nr:hypothetical protein A0H81_08118 [Grifola frondosa]
MSKRKLSDEAHDSNRPRKRPTDQDPLVSDTNSNQSLVIAYPSTSSPNAVRPAPFQQPSTLLTFSYTPSRTLEFTNSALRYYVDPPRGAELRYGYERWVKRPEEKGRLDGLLRAVERVRQKMDDGANGAKWLRDIGVVSWRVS